MSGSIPSRACRFTRYTILFLSLLCWCEVARGDELLDTLLKDYRAFGLPLPPSEAELSVLDARTVHITNGVRYQKSHLVFLVKQGSPSTRAVYWSGCDTCAAWRSATFRPAVPKETILKGTVPLPPDSFLEDGFPTYPDLALAVQCYSRGWTGLAKALLERSRQPPEKDPFKSPKPRPKDDRAALAELAWNYFCNQFASFKGDRRPIVANLKKLLEKPFGLDTKEHRNLIADMEATLTPTKSMAEGLEADLNSLLDLDVEGNWPGCGYPHFNNYAHWNPHYRKLRDQGLQAVPVLLRHLDDYRLTRCMANTSDASYTWHIRIADVVALLLNGLTAQPFAHEFRRTEGRGMSLDRATVNHWWEATRTKKEIDYLTENILRRDAGGRQEENGHVLHALGARFPDQLVKLFEERLSAGEVGDKFFGALVESRAAEKIKDQLLVAAAKSKDEWTRVLAQRYLADRKQAEATPILIKTLEDLPKTPAEDYWLANTRSIAQIAILSTDDRVWQALEKTAKRVDVGQRLEILAAFAMVGGWKKDRRAVRFLSGFLSDTEVRDRGSSQLFQGPCAGFQYERLAVRDFATEQLAHVLELKANPNSTWKKEDWANLREQVRAAAKKIEKSKEQDQE